MLAHTSRSHIFCLFFSHFSLSDPAASQPAVCPRRSDRQEEQETATEAAEEHGGSRCRPRAPADPLREGIKGFHLKMCFLYVIVDKPSHQPFSSSGRRFANAGYHEARTPVSTEFLCRKSAEPSPAAQAHQSVPQPRGEPPCQTMLRSILLVLL